MVPHRLLTFSAALMASAVHARAQEIKPRTIEGRFIAVGDYPLIKPRSIEPGRIIAVGEYFLIKSRFIEPGRIIAAGEYSPIKPRVIEAGRIIAAGISADPLKPRTIEPGRIIAVGVYPRIKPQTIVLKGWTASPPRGRKL